MYAGFPAKSRASLPSLCSLETKRSFRMCDCTPGNLHVRGDSLHNSAAEGFGFRGEAVFRFFCLSRIPHTAESDSIFFAHLNREEVLPVPGGDVGDVAEPHLVS